VCESRSRPDRTGMRDADRTVPECGTRSWKLPRWGRDGQEDARPPRVLLPFSAVYEILAAAVHTRPFARFTARTVIRSVPVWFCANLSTSM
jgi:hypothetical protein